jgi:hypothetical protein
MKSIMATAICVSCLISVAILAGCGAVASVQSLQPPSWPTITTPSLPNGMLDSPYIGTIQASGGVAPFSWTISSGALPHNLELTNSNTNAATISGTPDTAVQGAAFGISVMDSAHHSTSHSYTLSVLLEPEPATLTPANMSFVCTARLVAGGCSPPVIATLTHTGASAFDSVVINIRGLYFSERAAATRGSRSSSILIPE